MAGLLFHADEKGKKLSRNYLKEVGNNKLQRYPGNFQKSTEEAAAQEDRIRLPRNVVLISIGGTDY